MISSEQSTKQTRRSLQDEVLCERRRSESPLRFPSNKEQPTMKSRREAVLSVLDAGKPQAYIPAAFFLHFDPAYTWDGRRWTSTWSTSATPAWIS